MIGASQTEVGPLAFSEATFEFLAGLEANNSKQWFEDNRSAYEDHWKAPALDFIAGISGRMAGLEPPLQAAPKLNGSLRRINRDVRFSKDKSPYNARLHTIFWAGDHPNRSPAMHFVLQPDGVGFGAGQWAIEHAALAQLRSRIVSDADGNRLIDAIALAANTGARIGEPDLARLPKGFKADGERAELLRHKGFVVRTHDKPAPKSKMIGKGAEEWAMKTTEAFLPLIRWLVA